MAVIQNQKGPKFIRGLNTQLGAPLRSVELD